MCWRSHHCSPILFKEVKTKMLNFENIEDLVSHMFENSDNEDGSVSVVADKDLALSIVNELLVYDNTTLKYADVNDYEYDREYIVTLHDDVDTDLLAVAIEPAYNHTKEMYFGTDGYVLFHEDVNSKALIDMQNNENMKLVGHDLFTIGEDNIEDDPETDDESADSDSGYSIKVKVDFRLDCPCPDHRSTPAPSSRR